MKFYISCGVEYVEWAKAIRIQLLDKGYEVISDWMLDPKLGYGVSTEEELEGKALKDMRQVAECDVLVTNGSSAHGGAHVELGLALAYGRRVLLVGAPSNVFHRLVRPCGSLQAGLAGLAPMGGPGEPTGL